MNSSLKAFFILPLLISCSSDDEVAEVTPVVVESCKLISLKTAALVYDDLSPSGYNEHYPEKLTFEQDTQNRIVKVHGGFAAGYGIGLNIIWNLFTEVEDVVTYSQDTIAVDYSSNMELKPYEKKFVILNGELTYQKSASFNFASGITTTSVYTYEHSGNTIIEKRNGNLYRTLTFDNGNLIKSEQIVYHSDGRPYSKKIYEFSEYDNTENLLKGKFFLNGCFFRAFSNNNFKKHVYTKYMYYNGVEKETERQWLTLNFFYNENNIVSIFEQECM